MTISEDISAGLILRSRCKSIDKIFCETYIIFIRNMQDGKVWRDIWQILLSLRFWQLPCFSLCAVSFTSSEMAGAAGNVQGVLATVRAAAAAQSPRRKKREVRSLWRIPGSFGCLGCVLLFCSKFLKLPFHKITEYVILKPESFIEVDWEMACQRVVFRLNIDESV